jgi:hypothetical protein
LAGRAAESQAAQNGGASAQFGEAAAFFFAERQSFRAANGSGGSQSAQPSAPSLPVKLADEAATSDAQTGAKPPQNTAQNTDAEQAAALAATVANASPQDSNLASTAIASSAGTSQTPIAELSQLDETLQQIGINPQSISLFNRMAMLLYANDPAALKALVQSLQTGAQQLATASSAETGTAQIAVAAQNQGAPAAQVSVAASTQDAQVQQVAAGQASLQQASASGANASGGSTSGGSASGASSATTAITTSGNSGASAASSGAQGSSFSAHPFSAQLEELQFAFAAIESQQLSGDAQSQQAGQLLNVSA